MSFTSDLISWYEENKRELPFRGTRDPYLIWISEVILQQTRMEQGINYYLRFISRYPDIQSLAAASEEKVLKIWQGMGYYSRARNLHKSAQVIVCKFGGIFPETFSQIRELKGIGDYSAASIASLAFDEPQAAIDGNVFRFMARHFGYLEEMGSASGKKRMKVRAESLMDRDQPGTFNQAMIEYGALICTPQNPSCRSCIFKSSCYACQNEVIREIPVKAKPVKGRKRYFHYLVITFDDENGKKIIMNKRNDDDIWKNLYDFPVVESNRKHSLNRLAKTDLWLKFFRKRQPPDINVSKEFKHVLSHQVILATFYQVSLTEVPELDDRFVAIEQIESIPVSRLISRYWQEYFR